MKRPAPPAAMHSTAAEPALNALLERLRELIQASRRQALRAVDTIQVRTCWNLGHHIVEFEQGGAARATYGKRLLALLAERLTAEFGRSARSTTSASCPSTSRPAS